MSDNQIQFTRRSVDEDLPEDETTSETITLEPDSEVVFAGFINSDIDRDWIRLVVPERTPWSMTMTFDSGYPTFALLDTEGGFIAEGDNASRSPANSTSFFAAIFEEDRTVYVVADAFQDDIGPYELRFTTDLTEAIVPALLIPGETVNTRIITDPSDPHVLIDAEPSAVYRADFEFAGLRGRIRTDLSDTGFDLVGRLQRNPDELMLILQNDASSDGVVGLGFGTDSLRATPLAATLTELETVPASQSVDQVTVGDGGSFARLLGGDDRLTAGSGGDWVEAGSGNDDIDVGGGDDSVFAGFGNDTIRLGAGEDRVFGEGGDNQIFGEGGNDLIIGSTGAEQLFGGQDDDRISGGAGDDTLSGGAGNDDLSVESGRNTLNGDAGDDTLRGAWQSDYLAGGDGDDVLVDSGGSDTMTGGPGADDFTISPRIETTVTDFTAAEDTVEWSIRGDLAERLSSISQINEDGNLMVGNVTFDGVSDLGDVTDLNLQVGSLEADILQAVAELAVIYARHGDDLIEGSEHADRLFGGTDDDTLVGNDGNDNLNGGLGADSQLGGSGLDVLLGRQGDDTLYGGVGADRLRGNSGDDMLFGEDGGGNLAGGGGNDEISGGADNDTIHGGPGTDMLDGGAGDDRFYAQGEGDVMSGGDGADDFYFFGSGDHRVTDFSLEEDSVIVFRQELSLSDLEASAGQTEDGDLILYFDEGGSTTFEGITDFDEIAAAIVFQTTIWV